jgi:hypothetical protein
VDLEYEAGIKASTKKIFNLITYPVIKALERRDIRNRQY